MVEVKCHRCEWTWDTKSKAWRVSCPSCGAKVKVRGFVIDGVEIGSDGDERDFTIND